MAHDRLVRRSVLGAAPYVPGASASDTKARLGREDLIRLNWNENLFGPLTGVTDETAAALEQAWAYPEEAYEEFRHAVAAWSGARPDEVIPGHGIQALTLALVATFVEPGDRVIVPRPTYGLYAQVCATAGADVRRVAVDASLALDLEAIAAAARESRAKLVWICDPNNPTGRRLDPGEWATFLDALPEGCLAVADEAYVDYIAPEARIDRLADIRSGRPVIVMRTFSKIFGLAGLRLGYLLADRTLAGHVNAVQEPFNVNVAALAAGIASLRRVDQLPARRAQVIRARRALCEPLGSTAIHAVPSDANFVLLDLAGDDDGRIAEALARQGILLRAGSEFGLPGYARVTTGEEALMEDVARRLAALVPTPHRAPAASDPTQR
jgi:histidinol-phosphate aminotransferase